MKSFAFAAFVAATAASVSAHYTFPYINTQGAWVSTRETDNFESQAPVTNVNSSDIRCYTSAPPVPITAASTLAVAAGSEVTITSDGTIYHPGVINIYMAKGPDSGLSGWDPTGAVWFKVYEDYGQQGSPPSAGWVWPSQTMAGVTFTLPSELPAGNYLIRMEQIALHVAQSYGGAQFYISCSQVSIASGGSGTPGPLVAFPGAYTGYEPGILIDIDYPPVESYTPPGPAVWPGSGNSSPAPTTQSSKPTTTAPVKSTTSPVAPVKTTTTTTTASASGATQTKYGQCGGTGWTGPTACASGSTCKAVSPPYYSQCS